LDQRSELHGLGVELELSRLDLRQIQHLVDEAKQVSAGAVHALQRLLRLFCAKARAAFLTIISVSPIMALSGVRSSWLMLETNCDLFSLACWSCRFLSWISSNSLTFSIAIAAWSAKVLTNPDAARGQANRRSDFDP